MAATPLTPVRLDRLIPHKGVEDLLMWRDPKKSGIVLGSITLVYIILELSGWSFIALVCNSLVFICLAALLWANVGGIVGRPGPPVPKIFQEGLDEELVKASTERSRVQLNKVIFFAGRLLQGKDPKLTMQVAFGLYVFGWVGRHFTVLTFAFLVILLAFTIPKGYELKKDDCDKYLELAQAKTKEAYGKVTDTVRKHMPKPSSAPVKAE